MNDVDKSREAYYDEQLAPKLAALAQECCDHGMSFLAVVEYDPATLGRGRTFAATQNASFWFRWLHLCVDAIPNVDTIMFALLTACGRGELDGRASLVLDQLGCNKDQR